MVFEQWIRPNLGTGNQNLYWSRHTKSKKSSKMTQKMRKIIKIIETPTFVPRLQNACPRVQNVCQGAEMPMPDRVPKHVPGSRNACPRAHSSETRRFQPLVITLKNTYNTPQYGLIFKEFLNHSIAQRARKFKKVQAKKNEIT